MVLPGQLLLHIRHAQKGGHHQRREHFQQISVEAHEDDDLIHQIVDNGAHQYAGEPDGEVGGDA